MTTIGGATLPTEEVDALLLYAANFGLAGDEARTILREVAEAAENWKSVALRNGIAPAEIARFEPTLNYTLNAVRRD